MKYLLACLLFICSPILLANELDKRDLLFGIVKVTKANGYSQKVSHNSFIIKKYSKGKILEFDKCDKNDWCKAKDQKLFIPKSSLGLMRLQKSPIENNSPKILKNTNNTSSQESKKIKKEQQPCIKLNQIDLSDNNLLSKDEQDILLNKYKNKECISEALIKNILTDLNNYYANNGYITTKPFLKPQDINDGQIDIGIMVGKVDSIIDKDTNDTTCSISTAFIGQTNKPLNLRDIETSLEMINRVPSTNANFKIKPATKQGESKIIIEKKQTFPLHFSLGVSGSRNLEDKNPSLVANISYDNPFNINDIFKFTLNGSRIQKEYQSNKGHELNYSFPIGSYLIELIKSYSTYRKGVDGINDIYLSKGETKGTKFKISKILSRNQSNKYKLAFLLSHKDAKNYFEDELIETSSYKTTHIQANLIHTHIKKWGQINTTFSIYQGKDWLGARGDNYSADESDYKSNAKLEFTKYSLGSNIIYYLPNRTYKIDSNFHLQYSNDELYSSDKLSVGSDHSVRGYSSNYFGNTATYLKNDFIKDIGVDTYVPLLQNITLYVGLDYGYVPCEETNKKSCGTLYGSGTGIKTNGKNFSTNFSWTRPLKDLGDDFKIQNYFKYNFTVKF